MFKKLSLSIVSILLCFCLIFNSSSFRRDTYAFAPVAVAAWVAVSLAATACGIYFAKAHDTEEYKQWCQDAADWMSDRGQDVNDILSGKIFLDVAGRYLMSEDGIKTVAGLLNEWFASDEYKSKYGDITLPSFSSSSDSYNNICLDMSNLVFDIYVSHSGFALDFDKIYNSNSYFTNFSVSPYWAQFKYYDLFYFLNVPLDPGDSYYSNFYVIAYNDKGSSVSIYNGYMQFFTPASYYYSPTSYTIYSFRSFSPSSAVDYDTAVSVLPSCTLLRTYVNTDVLMDDTDDDIPVPAGSSPVELNEDNAVTNPQYITNVINNYGTVVEGIEGTEGTDVTYVPMYYPAYEDTGNVISGYLPGLTAPDVLTGTEGVTGVIPGVNELSPSIGEVTSDSFFDSLYDVLYKFFTYGGILSLPDGYWDDWFNKFKALWESKGLIPDFDFLDRDFSEIRIPDIYINWKGTECLLLKSDLIYYISDHVKGYVRALIYFLLLLHDRKRIIYIIRGSIPPDGDDINNGI